MMVRIILCLLDISNNVKFNWNKANVAHSKDITSTPITFSSSFSNSCFGIILSNSPSVNHYGHTINHTKTGYTLQTSRTSTGSVTNWDYYSFATGY